MLEEEKAKQEIIADVKNSLYAKQAAPSSRCPNCGYCPCCGRTTNQWPSYPYRRPYWYSSGGTQTQTVPNTVVWNKSFGTSNALGQSTICFIDFTGAKAH